MASKWLTTMKPSFQTEWLALPPKETHHILEKIALLAQDPFPDAKVKKQLKYMGGKLHRIRCGDYRIFYTFETPYISLLALRRRDNDTYDEDFDIEFLGGFNPDMKDSTRFVQPDWERLITLREPQKRMLPMPITQELLTNLWVPEEYHEHLLAIQTQEDLLNCSDIPDEILLQIDESLFERPLSQLLQQPDYVVQALDDLQRFKEGKLLSFLLKLSPEQEKVANWSMNVTGPTQVKGNPGTGKSTVALYRVRSLIQNLRKMNQATPHILYTTYTNALVKSSKQQLEQLLGDELGSVDVMTADKLVWNILEQAEECPKIAPDGTLIGALKRAMEEIRRRDTHQLKSLERLHHDYLLEEINQVIIARQIKTVEEYLATNRRGRKYRLSNTQKEAIWHVYEMFLQLLTRIRQETWQQVRLRAEAIFMDNFPIERYDAVVVDEAQDLDPSVLRLLVGLCKAMNRFFITADANQSIYKVAFSWTDVHENLKFQGRRTTILTTNYRSTRQISEAAQSYLANGALETESIDSIHMYSGPPPLVRSVKDATEEISILANFLPGLARECRLLTSSCAILCPTREAGAKIAEALTNCGLLATFMVRQDVDLKDTGIKVLTLHSSKGLEFPIVALAGFSDSRYANIPEGYLDEGLEEMLQRDRRTLFVGMTRAMRTLLVLVPANASSPLLSGFDSKYWNVGE